MTPSSRDPTSRPDAGTGSGTGTPHLVWPADQFYWSLIKLPGLARRAAGRGKVLPLALRLELEADVPLDTSDAPLHAVGFHVGADTVLACALPHRDLAAIDPAARSLGPDQIPAPLRAALEASRAAAGEAEASDASAMLDPARGVLNLLVGEFEPRPIRRARFMRHARRAAVLVACAGLLGLGLSRRAEYHRTQTASAQAARAALHRDLGVAGTDELTARVAWTQALAATARRTPLPASAAAPLASMLRAWPVQTSAAAPESSPPELALMPDGHPDQHRPADHDASLLPIALSVPSSILSPIPPSIPLSIRVEPDHLTASARIDGDPARWLAAFTAPPGWTLSPPSLSTQGRTAHLTLDLTRAPSSSPAGASPLIAAPHAQGRTRKAERTP